jgi:hypothetical protein
MTARERHAEVPEKQPRNEWAEELAVLTALAEFLLQRIERQKRLAKKSFS